MRQRRKQDGTWWVRTAYFLVGITVGITVIMAMDFVATTDILEAQQAARECEEMLAIFRQSDGEFGWPNCNHLGN